MPTRFEAERQLGSRQRACSDPEHVEVPGRGDGRGHLVHHPYVQLGCRLLDRPAVGVGDDLQHPVQRIVAFDVPTEVDLPTRLRGLATLGRYRDAQAGVVVEADGPAEPGHRRGRYAAALGQLDQRQPGDAGRIGQYLVEHPDEGVGHTFTHGPQPAQNRRHVAGLAGHMAGRTFHRCIDVVIILMITSPLSIFRSLPLPRILLARRHHDVLALLPSGRTHGRWRPRRHRCALRLFVPVHGPGEEGGGRLPRPRRRQRVPDARRPRPAGESSHGWPTDFPPIPLSYSRSVSRGATAARCERDRSIRPTASTASATSAAPCLAEWNLQATAPQAWPRRVVGHRGRRPHVRLPPAQGREVVRRQAVRCGRPDVRLRQHHDEQALLPGPVGLAVSGREVAQDDQDRRSHGEVLLRRAARSAAEVLLLPRPRAGHHRPQALHEPVPHRLCRRVDARPSRPGRKASAPGRSCSAPRATSG